VPRSHTPLVTLEMLDEVCAESGRYHDGSRTRGGEISHRNLIVLDQFDNIADDPALVAGGGPFFTWLRHAVEHAVVLISLRSVPAGLASSLADVGIRPREHSLQSLTSDQLRGAIREVSSSGAGRIDDALEEVLMARISGIRGDGSRYGREPAELLILVRTLRAMALHRAGGGFRFGSYRRIGGVEGVVHAMAESTWTQLSVEERLVARQILLELITVRGDSGETRRRVPCTEARRALGADSASVRVFDRLVDGRLLTIDQGQVYLSHDLLLTWNQLAGWVDEQAARLQQQH
jgi:hypothetical protein